MNYCFVCICEWASYKYFPACSTSWLLMTQQWGLSGFFALCQACPADTQGGGQCLVWWHVSVSRTISCFTQGTQVWRVLPPTTAYFVWQWHGWFLRKGWRLVINRWKKKILIKLQLSVELETKKFQTEPMKCHFHTHSPCGGAVSQLIGSTA